ncbi:hypothetical protein NUW58_g1390 [Xylaria curta]|uniref:Uncharacterized protein n=1 Tax=Xylaria curta TaxID=42375 RepID=A0ACC1PMZ3_9PEZI|nr:hypothetical protein NUW58_g1390 [Xylaria curta]
MAQGIAPYAYQALVPMWILLTVTFMFVLLRLYIRIKALDCFRADDYAYIVSFVFFFIYAILVQLSAQHGLGWDNSAIESADDISQAILYEMIGQTFLIAGNVTSKLSITFFLDRLVIQRGHKIFIWVPITIFGISVAIAQGVVWGSCQPASHFWDPRVSGHCFDPTPVALLAGSLSVFVDVCYAALPWYVLSLKALQALQSPPKFLVPTFWNINMAWRRKIVILLSLSLGLIAAACGIKRATELHSLGSRNYLNQSWRDSPKFPIFIEEILTASSEDTVQLVIWHAAELSVTLIAIGIPMCFHTIAKQLSQSGWLSCICGWQKESEVDVGGFGSRTYGGTPFNSRHRQTTQSYGNNGPGAKLGGNRVAVKARQSINFVTRKRETSDSMEAGLWQDQDGYNHSSWASQDNVADGAIVSQQKAESQTDAKKQEPY